MLKRFMMAVLLSAVMSGISWGTTVDPDYRYNVYQDLMNNTYANYLYRLYGDETGFNYQLRELSGTNTAGSQWFATVYENFYYTLYDVGDNTGNRQVYRRTTGGEIPEISISAIGNLIGGFNFMTVEEKQPYDYRNWLNIYDPYPDPVESFCLVIKNGTGSFSIDFGNPYASHFPYWYHWTTWPGSQWWNDRSHVDAVNNAGNEPIAFDIWVVSSTQGEIWARADDGTYSYKYTISMITESDDEGVITGYHYEINDLESGNLVCKTLNRDIVDNEDNVLFSVSEGIAVTGMNINNLNSAVFTDIRLYDPDGQQKYTLEEETDNGVRHIYVCDVKSVTESVRIDGFEDYTFTFIPSTEQAVNPGEYYTANVRLNSSYGNDYGSTLGYITFNQRADLMRGYTRYRESTTIPIVIANVLDGNAADEPLIFDMTVYDSDADKTAEHVISRVKFTWDAQQDMPNQDLGTFFMIRPSGQAMPTYYLETQITNRTGTRYRLYRYDMLGRTTGFQEILPAHWKYDLPLSPEELKRETLPPYFHLDAHSQIAPGLVTVYDHSVYGTVNTAYDTYESFQLSEYDSPNPKSLRLNYKRVGGMDLIEGTEEVIDGVRTREFIMNFADVVKNEDETVYELENLMGKPPVMVTAGVNGASFSGAASSRNKVTSHDLPVYINNSAINAFRYLKPVPDGLITLEVVSDDTESQDNTTPSPSPEQENQQQETPPQENTETAAFIAAADIKTVSADIAIQPLSIRMRIPRTNQLVIDHWTEFENAASSRALFEAFARYGTVWLRSDATAEMDANLFSAINSKGSRVGASAADCVKAFVYDDELFLDFIVILADGQSQTSGKTAYVEVFTDDGIPYVLIGDGKENGEWDMTFYISATGENPTPRDSNTSDNSNSGSEGNTSTDSNNANGDSGGGGGCNFGLLGIIGVLTLAGILRKHGA